MNVTRPCNDRVRLPEHNKYAPTKFPGSRDDVWGGHPPSAFSDTSVSLSEFRDLLSLECHRCRPISPGVLSYCRNPVRNLRCRFRTFFMSVRPFAQANRTDGSSRSAGPSVAFRQPTGETEAWTSFPNGTGGSNKRQYFVNPLCYYE